MTPFIVGNNYSRKDIYNLLKVPKEKQDGIWNTGYTTYDSNIYIFANILSSGRTGHDYNNKIIGNELNWFGKNNHSINTQTIQNMIYPKGKIYIFTRKNNQEKFTYQGLGKVQQYIDTKPVNIVWRIEHEIDQAIKSPYEVTESTRYIEGATKKVTINLYERNLQARKKCLEVFGYKCTVCNFDFKSFYGEIGNEYIQVHHLKEISDIGYEYQLDPIEDLRPVCPNCHAMLHQRRPAYSIEELKSIIIKNNEQHLI